MMSNVSAVTEACAAGSPETILGWNMLNGFHGKRSCLSTALCIVAQDAVTDCLFICVGYGLFERFYSCISG